MADLPTLYNSLVDTLRSIVRETELETDEVWRRITQAIKINLPDNADDLTSENTAIERAEEAGAYALARQAHGIATEALFEATAPELLPDDAIANVGYGIPASGTVDVPYTELLTLTITDDTGVPILDAEEAEQTIVVEKNSTVSNLYYDFNSETIFSYVIYDVENTLGASGCLYGRTEAMRIDGTYIPSDGYDITDPGLLPPVAEDVTGDASDESNFYVLGRNYMNLDGADRAWAPWIVIDPEKFGIGKVYTDGQDTTLGYLDTKLSVTPADASFAWLTKSVDPGGVADNEVIVEHGPWDSLNVVQGGEFIDLLAGGNGVEVNLGAAPADDGYISYTAYTYEYDANSHSMMTVVAGTKYIQIPDEKVKANAVDPAAGYLEDKIETTNGPAVVWLEQSTVGNKVLIEHSELVADLWFSEESPVITGVSAFAGGVTEAAAATGYCSMSFNDEVLETDAAGHAKVPPVLDTIDVRWLALPTDAATDDLIRWDGSKWVKEATVTQTVVTDISYDEVNHKFTKKTRSLRVIAEAAESATTTVTLMTEGCP